MARFAKSKSSHSRSRATWHGLRPRPFTRNTETHTCLPRGGHKQVPSHHRSVERRMHTSSSRSPEAGPTGSLNHFSGFLPLLPNPNPNPYVHPPLCSATLCRGNRGESATYIPPHSSLFPSACRLLRTDQRNSSGCENKQDTQARQRTASASSQRLPTRIRLSHP